MGQNISEQRAPKLHSELFRKSGKPLFGKKKFTIPPNAERPSSTSKPEVFQENEQFVLRWDPPAFDGGIAIIGYIIEHLELGLPQLGDKEVDETTQWYSSEPGQVTNNECILNNLIPSCTYQFRVKAENILGYSPPSDVSDPIVYNPFGELDDYFCIPRFITQLDTTYTVMRGEKLTLGVEVEGQPYPIVRWYDKNEMEILGLKTAFGRKRSLTFNSVDVHNAGKLTCAAENYMGVISSSTLIVVEAPPHIMSTYNDDDRHTPGSGAIFQAGELVRLKFNYSGAPTPVATLYHNGDIVAVSESASIEMSDDSVVVKLASGRREDRGEWICTLSNDLGEDSASVMLTITDRPSPPVHKPEVLQLSDNSCVLQWRDPEDDGGCPIQNFCVEYFRDGWGVWLKAVTTKGHSTKIRELIPGSKYKFRVKAENLYGVSEPSEESVEILITDLPSIIRSGDDGLMKTVEEEEFEVVEEMEELKPPPIPPRTRESSAEKSLDRRASPHPPQHRTEYISEVIPRHSPKPAAAAAEVKKLFSRREILGTPLNYLTLEPEIPVDTRPLTPEKSPSSPYDEELEKLKELLNEQESDYSEEEEDLEDEEFSYDFEKLQKEYEEDMQTLEGPPSSASPKHHQQQQEEDNKRLPVFQEITDRYNSLTREMDNALREYSVPRELEGESQLEEEESDFDVFPKDFQKSPPPPRFEKSPLRKFEIRSQDERLEAPPIPRQLQPFRKSPKRERSPTPSKSPNIPEIRSFLPESSPIRFIDSPVESKQKEPPKSSPRGSPLPTPEYKWSFEPEKSSPRRSPQPPGERPSHLTPSSFEPENSPYRELGRERSPNRSPCRTPRRVSPSHSLSRSPSPPPQPKRRTSAETPVLLHDRFTDLITMKVAAKDKKIASSLTNIHSRSRSSSTSRQITPVQSSSSLLDDTPPPPPPNQIYRPSQEPNKRRDRTAELQQKYNTVDERRRPSRPEEYEDEPMSKSKSYEFIDEVGDDSNLVVTECSLTVPISLRPGSRIELWRSDSALDNQDEQEKQKTPEVKTAEVRAPEEERRSRPRDYFKEPQQTPPKEFQKPKTPEPRIVPKYFELSEVTREREYRVPEPRKEEFKLPEPRKEEFKLPEPRKEEFKLPEPRKEEFKMPEPRKEEFKMPEPRKEEFKLPEPRKEFELHKEKDLPEPRQQSFKKVSKEPEVQKEPKKSEEPKTPEETTPEDEEKAAEEWLKKRRAAAPRRYIKHYEEIISEEEEKVKEEEEGPKVTPEERAAKARRVRRNIPEDTPKQEGEEVNAEEQEPTEEVKEEEESGQLVVRESFIRRYYLTIIKTIVYMILSPLLLISVPVTLALVFLLVLSHYLQRDK